LVERSQIGGGGPGGDGGGLGGGIARDGDWGGRGDGDGLEALELIEGAMVVALGRIDAALETGEGIAAAIEGQAERTFLVGREEGGQFVGPELGFDLVVAAEEPLGLDEGIDQERLLGGGGAEAVVVIEGEGFEILGGLAGDDPGAGVDAGFEGVETGDGLALGSAGAGGFEGVAAVRFDLTGGSHSVPLRE
jgi:hypothetical protein